MFFPFADTPNPPGYSPATRGLIFLNIAVFVIFTLPLSMSAPDLSDPRLAEYLKSIGVNSPVQLRQILGHLTAYQPFIYEFGYRPAEPSLLTLFTSMFLHGGLLHLGGNMLFLWIFGDNVEYRLGSMRFLLAYLGCGVLATLFFSVFAPGSNIPLVGASGAISGVLGAYFIWFPHNRVKTFVFLFPILMDWIYLPARLVLGFYIIIDNVLPFLFASSGAGGIAHGAHIGGFIGGVALALWKYSPQIPPRPRRFS
jgi:membrane associated rhomboid family serine protease